MFGVGLLALRNRKVKVKTGHEELIGQRLQVLSLETPRTGWVKYFGERWKFECDQDIQTQDMVEVFSVEGLILKVKKV